MKKKVPPKLSLWMVRQTPVHGWRRVYYLYAFFSLEFFEYCPEAVGGATDVYWVV